MSIMSLAIPAECAVRYGVLVGVKESLTKDKQPFFRVQFQKADGQFSGVAWASSGLRFDGDVLSVGGGSVKVGDVVKSFWRLKSVKQGEGDGEFSVWQVDGLIAVEPFSA